MNRPYANEVDESVTATNTKEIKVDNESQGSNFMFYYGISQIAATTNSSIIALVRGK